MCKMERGVHDAETLTKTSQEKDESSVNGHALKEHMWVGPAESRMQQAGCTHRYQLCAMSRAGYCERQCAQESNVHGACRGRSAHD